MTREEANAKISSLKDEIESKWEEIEELCEEHGLMVSRPDSDGYQEYYVTNKDAFIVSRGYDLEDAPTWIDWENRVPGWIGSAEME